MGDLAERLVAEAGELARDRAPRRTRRARPRRSRTAGRSRARTRCRAGRGTRGRSRAPPAPPAAASCRCPARPGSAAATARRGGASSARSTASSSGRPTRRWSSTLSHLGVEHNPETASRVRSGSAADVARRSDEARSVPCFVIHHRHLPASAGSRSTRSAVMTACSAAPALAGCVRRARDLVDRRGRDPSRRSRCCLLRGAARDGHARGRCRSPLTPRSSATTPYPRRWKALGVLALSLFVVTVGNTILNVGLPTIRNELGASASQLQWIVDGYLLVFAGLLLTAGSLGDRFGRRRALVTGLLVFGAGSLPPTLSEQRRDADRFTRADGPRRRRDHADDAVDPDQHLPRARAARRRSPSGPRCRASASPSGRSPAAGCSSTSAGTACSWSTCRSSPSRSLGAAAAGARVARSRGAQARPARRRPVDRRADDDRLGRDRGARARLGQPDRSSPRSRSA